MKLHETYVENFSLLEQSHQEIQLEAWRELHRKKIFELNELKRTANDMARNVTELRDTVNKKLEQKAALEQHIQSMSQLLADNAMQTSYDSEYQQRQQYYIQASKDIDLQTAFSNIFPENYKGVIIALDGLRFQYDRSSALLEELTNEGFLCFTFADSLDQSLVSVTKGYYQYNNEALLLKWLVENKLSPTILCTWVLQSAWFDLLETKTLWYDISEHEDLLWGLVAAARLKHYQLLKDAKLITYSDKKWVRYTAARTDAVLLETSNVKQELSGLSKCLEEHKHVE